MSKLMWGEIMHGDRVGMGQIWRAGMGTHGVGTK